MMLDVRLLSPRLRLILTMFIVAEAFLLGEIDADNLKAVHEVSRNATPSSDAS